MIYEELQKHSNLLEVARSTIEYDWVNYELVSEHLRESNVSKKFFVGHFSWRITSHILSIVRDRTKAGSCPVIHVMVQYFHEKNLSFEDIFVICSGLRQSMLKFFLEAKILDSKLFYEINKLFDLNFVGVIEEYKIFYDSKMDNVVEKVAISPKKVSEQNHKKGRVLNDDELKLLHKTQTNVINALDYVNSLDTDTLQEVQELRELENELDDIFEQFDYSKLEPELYLLVAQKLEQYVHAINLLFEFKDLAFSIANLVGTIEKYCESIDVAIQKKLITFLKNTINDMRSWRENVFISQSAIDIHYLDSSLLSVILQIELLFSPDEDEIDDDTELELF